MVIKSLELVNFRNYQKFKVNFGSITVFLGANGIGKSNILEAITVLSYAKSYRVHKEKNLIKFGEKYAQIKATLDSKKNINFVLTNTEKGLEKQVKVDRKKYKLSDLVGIFKTVIFSPESLQIVTGSPGTRRKYLDICLSQIDRQYLTNLLFIKKIIKQKNELLKLIKIHRAKKDELYFWNEKLAKCFYQIIVARKKFIAFINTNLQNYYELISNNKNDKVKLIYKTSFRDTDKINELIDSNIDLEIEAQKTLFGSHLDDILITLNDKSFADTGSRGEIRSIVLCLKLLEIEYLEQESDKNQEILLLLDDIFSELDSLRRKKIIQIVKNRQTIITTTDQEFIDDNLTNIKMIKLASYEKSH